MTAVALAEGGTELTLAHDQTYFTDKQVATLAQLGVDRASRADLAVFFHQCVRTGLDPFARQIYMIERQGKQTIQTGIDGFRLIARRATDHNHEALGYEDTQWCGEDGQWTDVWLKSEHPAASKVAVLRAGERFPAVALWSEYVATKRDGSITQMWNTKGALMLAKCAEALALRKAFPQDLSGIYTSDEMQQADNSPRRGATTRVQQAVAEHVAAGPDATDATDAGDHEGIGDIGADEPADLEYEHWAAIESERFEALIDGASTATELNVIAQEIAASALSGAPRDALRQRFSQRVKEVAA